MTRQLSGAALISSSIANASLHRFRLPSARRRPVALILSSGPFRGFVPCSRWVEEAAHARVCPVPALLFMHLICSPTSWYARAPVVPARRRFSLPSPPATPPPRMFRKTLCVCVPHGLSCRRSPVVARPNPKHSDLWFAPARGPGPRLHVLPASPRFGDQRLKRRWPITDVGSASLPALPMPQLMTSPGIVYSVPRESSRRHDRA